MKNIRPLLILLLAALSFTTRAQINAYASVSAISGTTLTLSSVNQTYASFSNGQQIIIMQMQDNVAGGNTTNTSTYGNVTTIANAGTYEVATISSIAGLPGSITITGATTNTYAFGANSAVQIISFPSFGSPNYTTTAAISALAWNGSLGGVVAMQVPGTLTLAYSVSADGAGFRGGTASANYEVNCEPSVYASNSTNYGTKGEGIQVNATGLLYARNALATGGGGGSDDNGGGGGGSNYSAGGQGGAGWTCSASPSGGYGGNTVGTYINSNRLFMGGGGGGGQQNNSVGSNGANGGGIIILKATTLVTSCSGSLTISAGGASAANSGNDGSGGGGAAGSIYLNITNYSVANSCLLTVQSNGGNGGNVTDAGAHGGGGGGGQGAIIYNTTAPGANVTSTTTNGAGGTNNTPASSSAGNGAGSNNSGVLGNKGATVLASAIRAFTGQVEGASVVLNWTMESEGAETIFAVERSADGLSYTSIGSVNGNDLLHTQESYSFTDLAPAMGQNYYRLKQTDQSGVTNYSSIILESFSQQDAAGVAVYPNPVIDHFTIRLPSAVDAAYSLSLYDVTGRAILVQTGVASGGQVAITATRPWTPGVYFVQVRSGQDSWSSELLVK